MAPEGLFAASAAAVVEDVLRQHGSRLKDAAEVTPLAAPKKAELAASRRYEAASWLRQYVAGGLPEEPSEEEFRRALRSGYILCNAINMVVPGRISRVIETPDDFYDQNGTPLLAYQYFENIRNFFVAAEEMGLPMFEVSDLEQDGKCYKVVNCVLALKSYSEWKQSGASGTWKYGGSVKPSGVGKFFVRKNSEPFSNSLSRSQSVGDKFHDSLLTEQGSNGKLFQLSSETLASRPWSGLVREILSDRKPEEVPILVESILHKLTDEFEQRIANQNELTTAVPCETDEQSLSKTEVVSETEPLDLDGFADENTNPLDESSSKLADDVDSNKSNKLGMQLVIFEQQKNVQELRNTLTSTRTSLQLLQIKYSEDFCNLGKQLQSLAHAASGYHKVLEENRKLYNQVQDLKGSIRVYCRVRPFLPGQSCNMSTIGHIDDQNITVITPLKYVKDGRKSFTFNKVFGPSTTQEEVFVDTQPLIRSVLDGFNVCIFAYGQTGSGKTFTMTGPKQITTESQGVNFRALNDLFFLSEQRKEAFVYDISVQMLEIYNEQVRDLLSNDSSNKRLEIRNSSQSGLNVPDANLVPVSSPSDVIELMNLGHGNRAVSATALNDRSSRSHSCLTVHVQGKELTSGNTLRGCMHLIDLAGSERVDKAEVTGERLKEAQHINKSLSALGDVISALAQKNSHVPYRNSKLTQLLQDSLGGQAKTLMFVHISPETDAVGETISTLKFAERVSTVELGTAKANKESTEVKELKEQIASLKEALAKKNGEPDLFQKVEPSPTTVNKLKGGVPSQLPSFKQRGNDGFSSHIRQPMGDVGNIEEWSNSSLKQLKPSYDIQELLMSTESSAWSDNVVKDGKNEINCDDWVDNVVSKQQFKDNDLGRDWQGENTQLPESFYQRYMSNTNGRLTRKGSLELDIRPKRPGSVTTDDSDEFDMTTSDSSETDMLWQFNQTKVSSNNGSGSKIKKPQSRPTRNPELRTPSQPHGPSPSRKVPNSSIQTPLRTLRSADGKRHSNSKIGSGK